MSVSFPVPLLIKEAPALPKGEEYVTSRPEGFEILNTWSLVFVKRAERSGIGDEPSDDPKLGPYLSIPVLEAPENSIGPPVDTWPSAFPFGSSIISSPSTIFVPPVNELFPVRVRSPSPILTNSPVTELEEPSVMFPAKDATLPLLTLILIVSGKDP